MHRPFGIVLGCVLFAAPLAAGESARLSVKKEDDALAFYAGDKLVTRYRVGPRTPRPIFWPVHAPNGAALTRAWPMQKPTPGGSVDHPHQKSAWFFHGDVIPEGVVLKDKIEHVEGVDFWSEAKGHGKIVVTRIEEPTVEEGHVSVKTHNEWRTGDGTTILKEIRIIHVYTVGAAWLVVVESDLSPTVRAIVFGDTKEGAFGVRVNDRIRADKRGKGKIVNAKGQVGESAAWGRIADWCDYSGPIDGQDAGIALFADPRNPAPSAWHVRGYGLMAANPFGRHKSGFPDLKGKTDVLRLQRGDHLRFRYGMLLHDGDAVSGHVAEHYRRFVALGGKQ